MLFSARFCGHARRGSTSASDTVPTGGHLGPAARSSASTHTIPHTTAPKTQTTSPGTPHCQRFSLRWSALWARHQPERRPHHHQTGGIAPLGARHAETKLAQREPYRAISVQNSPSTSRIAPLRYKTRPARVAQPHFGTKLTQQEPRRASSGTKLTLLAQNGSFRHVLRVYGELCTAVANKKPRRVNFLPHARRRRG